MSQIRYRGACTIPKDVPLHSILVGGVENTDVFMDKTKMKFIYKLPHGYFNGGGYFKYAPTVNASAWANNNLLICVEPKQSNSN